MPVAFSICVVYSVFASAVLVVCTLLNRRRQAEPLGLARSLEYVPISESVLLGWARKCSNLVIFDLHAWDLPPPAQFQGSGGIRCLLPANLGRRLARHSEMAPSPNSRNVFLSMRSGALGFSNGVRVAETWHRNCLLSG